MAYKIRASNEHHLTVKIVLIGDLGVGKTTFLQTFMEGKFTRSNSLINNLECKKKYFLCGDEQVYLKLFDTAGQEKFRSLTASYYRGVQACIIFFDVTNETSFRNVSRWIEEVNDSVAYTDVVIVLVGTRCHEDIREVSPDQATQFADTHGFPYLEVSAEQDVASVNSVCTKVVELVLEKKSVRNVSSVPRIEVKHLNDSKKWKTHCVWCCS